MTDDPIVAEVRAQRAQRLETAGGTVEALVRFLRQQEVNAGRVSISPPQPVAAAPTRAG